MAACHFTPVLSLHTLFSCIMNIVQLCRYVRLSCLALQSDSSNCLVLIMHRQLGNYRMLSVAVKIHFYFQHTLHINSLIHGMSNIYCLINNIFL